METNMHAQSVAFRKSCAALEDLGLRSNWMVNVVAIDIAIVQTFREWEELTAELQHLIACNFYFIVDRIGALSEHGVGRINAVQKQMISAARLAENVGDYWYRSTGL